MGIMLSGFADEIDQSLDRQLQVAKATGYRWIELRRADGIGVADFTAGQTAEVKEKLAEAGVSVSAIGSPIGKYPITEDFAPHLAALENVIQVAQVMGTRLIRMFSFHMPEGAGPAQHRDAIFRRMEQMIDMARSRDVVLLHENEKGIYGDNATRCLDLMQHFAGPHFQAVFDFANFVQCGQDTMEAFELLAPYVRYVHIKDARVDGSVVPAGDGTGCVKAILGRLQVSGYHGFLSVEPHLGRYVEALAAYPAGMEGLSAGEVGWRLATEAIRAMLAQLQWQEG